MNFRIGPPANKGNGQGIKWLRDHADYDKPYCLIWPFSTTRGYGHASINGKLIYAHRYMCELANGPPPAPEYHATHSCGRGEHGCVNPRHLSWKTQSENELDKREHGTSRSVTMQGSHYKLTPQQVLEIKSMAGTKSHEAIAVGYGVSRRTVGMIIKGQTWRSGIRHPGTSRSNLYARAAKARAMQHPD